MKQTKHTKTNFFLVYIAILLSTFLNSPDLAAHTVFLKDLSVVYGTVQKQDDNFVYLSSDKGPKKIPKKNVAKILFQDIKEDIKLKKILGKIRSIQNSQKPKLTEAQAHSTNLEDIEIESAKYLLTEIEHEEKETIHKDSLLRSLVFPGWGHFYKGNRGFGYLYSSLFIASISSVVYTTLQVNRANTEYRSTVRDVSFTSLIFNPNFNRSLSINHFVYANQKVNDKLQNRDKALGNQRIAISAMVGVYLIQIIHNYFTEVESIDEKITPTQTEQGFKFNYSQEREPFVNSFQTNAKLEYVWTF